MSQALNGIYREAYRQTPARSPEELVTHKGMQPLHIPPEFWDRADVNEMASAHDFRRLFLTARVHYDATQTQIAAACGLSQGVVSRIMKGARTPRTQAVITRIADGLGMPNEIRVLLGVAPNEPSVSMPFTASPNRAVEHTASSPAGSTPPPTLHAALDALGKLRRHVDHVIGDNAMSEASIEAWEEAAVRLGTDTRHRPNEALLTEVAADVADLQVHLARRQPLSVQRRLTLVAAQLAGLMSLTLLKAGSGPESRAWARTARIAADEADEPTVRAWVRAQEAYAHYYSGALHRAVEVARDAQAVVGHRSCVGVPLAAALEGRACAMLGDPEGARHALVRAETALERLAADETRPSAFGYNEAQLRFHEGNALTHLHDTGAAWTAQQRALNLYPATDYMDRALVRLDRAHCLVYDGDARSAASYATQALLELSSSQRDGLIAIRAREVLALLPADQRALPAGQDLREILASRPHQETKPC